MLISKDIEKRCEYCAWADATIGRDMLCYHHGPTKPSNRCRRFKYDPFKRTPPANTGVRQAEIPSLNDDGGAV
jgi:hypothetical protein